MLRVVCRHKEGERSGAQKPRRRERQKVRDSLGPRCLPFLFIRLAARCLAKVCRGSGLRKGVGNGEMRGVFCVCGLRRRYLFFMTILNLHCLTILSFAPSAGFVLLSQSDLVRLDYFIVMMIPIIGTLCIRYNSQVGRFSSA